MMGIYNLFFLAQPRPQVPTKEAFSRVVKEKGDWSRKKKVHRNGYGETFHGKLKDSKQN